MPHFVAVDHETKSLVISIRGTMSIADMFTGLSHYLFEYYIREVFPLLPIPRL